MKDKEARAEIRQVKEDVYREILGLRQRVEDLEASSTIHIGWGKRAKLDTVVTLILRHLGLKLVRNPEEITLEPVEGVK
jgi:CRISPR/Cas system CSM-associated protein Csm5 (group 7 of RAMP superfamily)